MWIETHSSDHSRSAIDESDSSFTIRQDCAAPLLTENPSVTFYYNNPVISWTTNEKSNSQIEYGVDKNYGAEIPTYPTGGDTDHSVTIYNDNLSASTTYHYRVISKDKSGNKLLSNDFTFSTVSDIEKPATVNDLIYKNVTQTSVKLIWTAPKDNNDSGVASEYDIRYSTSKITGGNWANATQTVNEPKPLTAGNSQEFAISDLIPETKYYFVIRAVDKTNNISDIPSNLTTVTTGIDIAAPTISDIKVENVTKKTADIVWKTNELSKGWIQYGTDTNYEMGESMKFFNSYKLNHNVRIKNLNGSTIYHFKIFAKDKRNNYYNSSDNTFMSWDITAPSNIDDLRVKETGQDFITIEWTAIADSPSSGAIKNYDIRYSSENITNENWNSRNLKNVKKIIEGSAVLNTGNTQNLKIIGLKPSTKYYFALTSMDTNGNVSKISNVVYGTTKATKADIGFLKDGDLIRVPTLSYPQNLNVWIVKISANKKILYKRLIMNPQVLSLYNHLSVKNIKLVSKEVFDSFDASPYVKSESNQMVYKIEADEEGDTGIKHQINISNEIFYSKVNSFAVFIVNEAEINLYKEESGITNQNDIKNL